MNYPVWLVPIFGTGWVVGSIAIIHVLISHFAVGGGFFLPLAEMKAMKEGRRDWFPQLKMFSKFFLVLTGVFGAVTGVGIWFAIGLASPEGTSTLIHNFVFAWGSEWMIFLIELTLAAVYYYTWDRIPDELHLRLGFLYAIFAFLTLVIINGILTFMLTPSKGWLEVAGTGHEADAFFQAFFNPTYWPSLFLRTLVCISLAGIFSLAVFSRLDGKKDGKVKREMIRWSAMWLLPAFILMPFCFLWYLWMVPASQRELMSLGISTIGSGAFTQVTRLGLITLMTSGTIVGVVYFLAYQSPRDFKFGHAMSVVMLALIATASTECVREMLRKPYVIDQWMYSNGVRKTQVAKFNQEGFLTHSPWQPPAGATPVEVGRRMFMGECMACHTLDGYRGIKGLLGGRDEKAIGNILEMLHKDQADSPYSKFMPPLVGTDEEIADLRIYLASLVTTPPPTPPSAAPPLAATTPLR